MSAGATSRLRRGWAWALAVSTALSAWAVWWPQSDGLTGHVPGPGVAPRRVDGAAPHAAENAQLPPLPAPGETDGVSSDGYRLNLAVADPFAAASAPPAPSKVAPVAAPVMPPQDARPLPPAANPSLQLVAAPAPRYFGRLRSPDGTWQVFLTDPGASGGTALATPGAVLSSGWQVAAVTAQAVRLERPGVRDAGVVVPLPAMTEEDGR
jgi:hypothetical protein